MFHMTYMPLFNTTCAPTNYPLNSMQQGVCAALATLMWKSPSQPAARGWFNLRMQGHTRIICSPVVSCKPLLQSRLLCQKRLLTHNDDWIPTFVSEQAGLDSLAAIELRNAIASHFSIMLPATAVFDHPSLAALAEYIAGQLAPSSGAAEETAYPMAVRQPLNMEAQGPQQVVEVLQASCMYPGCPPGNALT